MTHAPQKTPPRLVSLPRTRRLSWVPTALEFTHQLVLACWLGGIVVLATFVLPQLRSTVADPRDAAWAGLELTMRLNFVSAGAGSFLLLIALVMYVLALRSQRATLVQIGILLGMTGAAVASHVVLGPGISEILRANADLALLEEDAASRLGQLGAWNAFCLAVQFTLGAVALVPGVRRWYRYVAPHSSREEPYLVAADGD